MPIVDAVDLDDDHHMSDLPCPCTACNQPPFNRVSGECFAKDCRAGAKPNMLMCWAHWRRVPRAIQRVIWASNYQAHPDYEASRLAARAVIGEKEGNPPTPAEKDLVARYLHLPTTMEGD